MAHRYDAFLSYSHNADAPLARALHGGLHSLAKPWYRSRALHVFRDNASLAASPALWADIIKSLRESRYFVILASPASAASPWVQREVDFWRQHREPGTFLIALTDGAIVWDHEAGDFDWDRTTALPRTLRSWFDDEPRWVDLTLVRDTTQMSLLNPNFRDAIGTLAAPIHGVTKDDLDSEDIRRHRSATRLRRAAVTGLVLLTTVSTVLGITMFLQSRAAVERAVSRELSTTSTALGDTEPDVAQLLSVASWRLDQTPAARGAMLSALTLPGIRKFPRSTVSLDGSLLASARPTADGAVRLWDLRTHRPLPELDIRPEVNFPPFPNGSELSDLSTFVALSHDGSKLAAVSSDGTSIWDIKTGQSINTLPGHQADTALFNSDQTIFAAFSPIAGDLRFWDIATRREIAGFTNVSAVTFNPAAGNEFAIAGRTGEIFSWDARRDVILGRFTGNTGWVHTLTYSPDGATLASGGDDRAARLWDTASHTERVRLPAEETSIFSAAFSHDGSALATASANGIIRHWDPNNATQLGSPLQTRQDYISPMAFASDRSIVAPDTEKTMLWELSPLPAVKTTFGVDHSGIGSTFAVSPDGSIAAVGDTEGTMLWDMRTRTSIGTLPSEFTNDLAFIPNGSLVTVNKPDNQVTVWDVHSKNELGKIQLNENDGFALSSDGTNILVRNGNGLAVWNVMTGKQIGELPAIGGLGDDELALSPDGITAAVGTETEIVLWNTRDEKQTTIRETPDDSRHGDHLEFSPDGTTLALINNTIVRFFDVATGAQRGSPIPIGDSPYANIAFSSDSTLVAVAGENDGTVRLWDILSGTPFGQPFPGHTARSNGVAFSRDGRIFASVGGDTSGGGTVSVWPAPRVPLDVPGAVCARVRRTLTEQEWTQYIPDLPYQDVCAP
jgi:WD40 repeat protein